MRVFVLLVMAGLCRAAHHLGDHAIARFNMNGVRGYVEFNFISGNLTIESNLTGLSGTVTMAVRSWPIFPGQSRSPCARLGKVFNPTSASGAVKPLGDLSGRLPLSPARGAQTVIDSSGLEVLGSKGVSGRSLLLTEAGVSLACASIITAGNPDKPPCGTQGVMNRHQTLRATFRGRVSGTLLLRRLQGSNSNHSTFYHKLYYTDDSARSTDGHHFHVHNASIGRRTWPCTTAMIGPIVQHLGHSLSIGNSPSDDLATRVEDVSNTMRFEDLVNRAVAIHANDTQSTIIACADFKMLQPRRYVADLGNNMNVAVEQASPLDSTDVQTNAGDNVVSVSVKKFPVKTAGSCGDSDTGTEFNPFGTQKPSGRGSGMTRDKYPAGDLTDKLSGAAQLGKTQMCDNTLSLFGSNSIAGRSVVVRYQDGSMRCGTLRAMSVGGQLMQAKAVFRDKQGGTIAGTLVLNQYKYADGSLGETTIDTDGLRNSLGMTTNHNYHVHIARKGFQTDKAACGGSYAMGHYNPSNVSYSANSTSRYQTGCGPDSQLRCELGDTSKKSGTLSMNNSQAHRQDSWMPLDGPYTVLGRSIVIHDPNRGAPRYACANIVPMSAQDFQIGFKKSQLQGKSFNQTDFENRVKSTPSGQSVSLLYTTTMEDSTSGCFYVSAAVDGSSSQQVANNLPTANLGPYTQDGGCIMFSQGGGAAALSASLSLLFSALVAFLLL